MNNRWRGLVLVLMVTAVGLLLLRPFLQTSRDPEPETPREAMEGALAKGDPLFIEFYSDT